MKDIIKKTKRIDRWRASVCILSVNINKLSIEEPCLRVGFILIVKCGTDNL